MPRGELARDTIAAVATPPGRGGIGVVRISGSDVPRIARSLLGGLPVPRRATVVKFRDAGGAVIDEGIALYFPGPRSYTGEAVLELQGHGGPIVMQLVLRACLSAGARLAEPGEFTRRAFLEGKIDLAQAEAVADLIDAASREAARSALRSLSGEFSAAVGIVRAMVIDLRALIEAMLDFPEEELDELHRDDAIRRAGEARDALVGVLEKSRQGSLLRGGVRVVLAGEPNVGKSSLLNRLAGEERAIVTAIPGTTRDVLREAVEMEGVPLLLVDTAGLREAGDEVERLGVARARSEAEGADIVLAVMVAGTERAPPLRLPAGTARIDVYNKADLAPAFEAPEKAIAVSAKTGEGLDRLRAAILRAAGWSSTGESVFLARERHVSALERAKSHLEAALGETGRWEIFAEELRLTQEALGSITGEFTAEDLLGEIFARFCIGK